MTCLFSLLRTTVLFTMCLLLGIASLAGAADPVGGRRSPRPARIVSLSPAITESLYLLGLKDTIGGVTLYCSRPAEAKTKPVIGTVIEPDLERIIKLNPDLVLAMGLTNQKAVAKMRSLGLKVLTYEIPRTFSGICDIFQQIGDATGMSREARRIIDTARRAVDDIAKRTGRLSKPKVMIELGSKPFFVATRDFFVNDYLELAGGVNIFRDSSSGSVGREDAILRNPDVILIVTMGLSGENERRTWERYHSVNAVKNGRVHIMDSDDLCSPTPLSFAKSLKNIAGLLHPYPQRGGRE